MNAQAGAWDDHAHTYARFTAPFTGFIAQALFQTAAARLPAAPRILEVACGHGDLAYAATLHCLAEANTDGKHGTVVATDFSQEMVNSAARRLATLDAGHVARCEVQDGQALAFADGEFDAVFSAFGIFLFPDRMAGWREAARVLRRGGWLATAVWRDEDVNELVRLQMGPLKAALPERLRATLPRPGWLDIASEEGLQKELVSAGFSDPEVTTFDAVKTMPTPHSMWDLIRDNPMSRMLLAACTDDEGRVVEQAVLADFIARAGGPDRPLRLAASCHFALARRI